MLETLTASILGEELAVSQVLICTMVSIILGLISAGIYMIRNKYNKGFVMTLALLPVIVQIVIMLVNGNLGTGIAVMGAFNLVRFRSIPGSARDICSIFLGMAIGLATGMGYIFYAVMFLIIIGALTAILVLIPFGEAKKNQRVLKITIPENLDYDNLFDDLFAEYTLEAELDRIKTTNMGSLYELTYDVQMKTSAATKDFLDKLRCRNGNLNIVLSRPATNKGEL